MPFLPHADRPRDHASNPAVNLGCTDCHGGDAGDHRGGRDHSAARSEYQKAQDSAHVLPRYPEGSGTIPSSANPQRTYTLLNRESPEFVRFINPRDYPRRARGLRRLPPARSSRRPSAAYGTCAMFWGGASYNNGILPIQALHPRRVVHAATAAGAIVKVRSIPDHEAALQAASCRSC